MIKCFPIWRMMCVSERKAKIIHSKPGHGEIESCHFTIGCIICLLAVCHLVANQTWNTACRYQKVQVLYTHVKPNTFLRHRCVILAHKPVLHYAFGSKQLLKCVKKSSHQGLVPYQAATMKSINGLVYQF